MEWKKTWNDNDSYNVYLYRTEFTEKGRKKWMDCVFKKEVVLLWKRMFFLFFDVGFFLFGSGNKQIFIIANLNKKLKQNS